MKINEIVARLVGEVDGTASIASEIILWTPPLPNGSISKLIMTVSAALPNQKQLNSKHIEIIKVLRITQVYSLAEWNLTKIFRIVKNRHQLKMMSPLPGKWALVTVSVS